MIQYLQAMQVCSDESITLSQKQEEEEEGEKVAARLVGRRAQKKEVGAGKGCQIDGRGHINGCYARASPNVMCLA